MKRSSDVAAHGRRRYAFRPRWLVLLVLLVTTAVVLSLTLGGSSAQRSGENAAAAEAKAEGADADFAKNITSTAGQAFSGQITDTSCGSSDFTADPSSTINVTVTAEVPTNDIAVNLVHGGQVVHNEDTGVGQETFVYSVFATTGGAYTVQVCKSPNPLTPFEPAGGPYPYDGVFTDVDVATPGSTIPPPGSISNPITVTPTPRYRAWN